MKVGILTGGGDCPGLNAVIRAVTKSLIGYGQCEVLGIADGFEGLMAPQPQARPLRWDDVSGILHRGGTILGTSNSANPLKDAATLAQVQANVQALGLQVVVAIGGDGTILHEATVSADSEYLDGGKDVSKDNTVKDRTSAYDQGQVDPADLRDVDLSIKKTVTSPTSGNVEVGGQIAYRLTVKNEETVKNLVNGNAKVVDVLSEGLELAGAVRYRAAVGSPQRLGCVGYGMGAKRFQTTLALGVMGPPVQMSMTECSRIVKMYRKINQAIVEFWRECENVLEAMTRGESGSFGPGGILQYEGTSIWLPNGMGLHYPGLRALWNPNTNQIQGFKYKSNGADKHIYGGLLCENIVQALAGVIIREEMVEVDNLYAKTKLKKGEIAKITTMTHDEIVSVIPERLGQKLLDANLKIMKTPPAWAPDLPINAEAVGWATNYSI
mgnify:CR=1 FL=1